VRAKDGRRSLAPALLDDPRMTPTNSTTAWALHDLALATSLGGVLFGRYALHPSVSRISDPDERGAVLDTAWRRFSAINLASHGVFAATWLFGRTMLSGREIDRSTHALVAVKDALVATAVVSGVASFVAGAQIKDPTTGAPLPMDREGCVAADAPKRARIAQRVTTISAVVNLASLAGIVGLTAVLAMKAGRSSRWSVVSRWLP
jgi:hypothetical protein